MYRALSKTRSLKSTPFNALHLSVSHKSPRSITADVAKDLYIYQRKEYDEGMHTFDKPITIDATLTASVDYDKMKATVLYNIGKLCMRLDEDNEAAEFLHRALTILRPRYSPIKGNESGVSVVAILHNIGHIQYRGGYYNDALHTYTKALNICTNTFFDRPLDVASTLNCLGVLHFHMPKVDTEKAMDMYVKSLSIRRAVLGDEHRDVPSVKTISPVP